MSAPLDLSGEHFKPPRWRLKATRNRPWPGNFWPFKCANCGEVIPIGAEAWTHTTRGNSQLKVCQECASKKPDPRP